MNKPISILVVLMFISQNYFPAYAEENGSNKKESKKAVKQKVIKDTNAKQFNMVEKKQPVVPDVSFGAEDSAQEELIQVSVRNEFDEEIKVKFDTNREYPIAPHESISLGQRKSGKYTLTVYSKTGEFVDNLTKDIDLKNKFILNKETVSNSDKITGLTTGQKVAITAGALGAAAVGGVLINKALQNNQEQTAPPAQQQELPGQNQLPLQVQQLPIGEGLSATGGPALGRKPIPQPEQPIVQNNQFAPDGMAVKFLNMKYPQVTVIVEGTDGQPIGNNWVISLALPERKPQPFVFNGEKITINPEQKIKAVLQNGLELQRYGFELDVDPVDNFYVWVLK